jgi:lactoylglutathione lyase
MPRPLIQKVDCLHIDVPDISAGLAFYAERLGHVLLWRTETAAGMKMPDTDAEIVLDAAPTRYKIDLLVDSAEEAAARFVEAGGTITHGPFEIDIGNAVAVRDPFGNEYVLLDTSKGHYVTGPDGEVIGVSGTDR